MDKTNKQKEVLRFIDLYRSHEILWNMHSPLYRRHDLKMKAYKSISAEMEMSVEDVKKKIKSLRTAYSAEKSKVEKRKMFGSPTEPTYTPTLFWYNEMSFLEPALIRRTTADSSNQEDFGLLIETSLDCDLKDYESESASTDEAKITTPTCSKKRKRSSEPKTKFDDALEKPFQMKKDASVFEIFAKNIGRQLQEFPEEEAYQLMADIQVMLSKRKIDIIRKDREANPKIENDHSYL